MSNRIINIIKISVTAIFITLCAVIPSWFAHSGGEEIVTEAPPTSSLTRPASGFDERGGIYLANRSALQNGAIAPTPLGDIAVDALTAEACSERLNYLLENLTVDEGAETGATGAGLNLYTVADEGGVYIRVLVYFKEWDADWHNWIYLAMDADTQDVYEAYISSETYSHFDGYYSSLTMSNRETLDSIETVILRYYDAKPGQISHSTEGDRGVLEIGLFPPGGDERFYKISGYTTVNEEKQYILVDYRIICQNVANLMQQPKESDTIAP